MKTTHKHKKTADAPEKSNAKNRAQTSYYTHGGTWNPQTEVGIQGAYGSQGERDDENSYTTSVYDE